MVMLKEDNITKLIQRPEEVLDMKSDWVLVNDKAAITPGNENLHGTPHPS